MDLKSVHISMILSILASTSLGQANSPVTNKFSWSFANRRNVTGHRTYTMDITYENTKIGEQAEMLTGADYESAVLDKSETIILSARAIVSGHQKDPRPPPGYELVNGLGYYKMYTEPSIWEVARDKCILDGAHLIVINSEQESDVVRTYFARKPKLVNATTENHTHIGFHDRYTEGKYETVLGGPLNATGYVKWNPTEPSGSSGQICGLANANALFYDNPCYWKLFFICEYHDEGLTEL